HTKPRKVSHEYLTDKVIDCFVGVAQGIGQLLFLTRRQRNCNAGRTCSRGRPVANVDENGGTEIFVSASQITQEIFQWSLGCDRPVIDTRYAGWAGTEGDPMPSPKRSSAMGDDGGKAVSERIGTSVLGSLKLAQVYPGLIFYLHAQLTVSQSERVERESSELYDKNFWR
ncbi:hypothetical protein LTS18_002051, partial [Coniosporium uncinatum]